MSDTPDILHEEDTRAVIQDEIEKTVGLTGLAIDDVAFSADTDVEGALNALGGTVNDILAVLRTNGLIAD